MFDTVEKATRWRMVVLLETDLPRLSAAVQHVRRLVSKPCLHSEKGKKKEVNQKSVASKNVSHLQMQTCVFG